MGFLTFDPVRVALLRRALLEVAQRFESTSRFSTSDEMTGEVSDLLNVCHDLLRLQITRVEESLGNIEPIGVRPPISCGTVDEAVHLYSNWSRETRHWWTLATTRNSTPSDDILRRFGCNDDPLRAGDLIDSLSRVELLTLGTADLSLVEIVWSRATDPSTTPPLVAGTRISRLLEVVFEKRPWERGVAGGSIDSATRTQRDIQLRELVARVVAPWQLHFTRPDSLWSWSGVDGTRRLHQLSELASASDALMLGLARALRFSLSNLPDDPSERLSHIDSVARAVGTSLEIRRMSLVDRAGTASDLDTLRSVIGALSLDGPWPVSMIVEAGARWVGDYFDTSDVRVRQATLESLGHREILASLAVLTVFTSAIERMTTPNSRRRTADAKSRVTLSTELRHTYQSIDNAASRGQSLAQLVSS